MLFGQPVHEVFSRCWQAKHRHLLHAMSFQLVSLAQLNA